MIVLCVRTDKPEAELYLHDDTQILAEVRWQAHRELAETIHKQIQQLFGKTIYTAKDLTGIVTYVGPGSFTGLRIGLSVTNAMAYALAIDAAGASGEHWVKDGLKQLLQKPGPRTIMPEYGADAHITQPKK